ncbi:MAG: hypothetical protein BWY72_02106 [Bacteroidetes bacterium ADurb.Bin416]|nr:MAG: hypothetical protein BWY72_02106 [Bacteroidetes bacterium ADurb.Bin416]
MPADEDVGTGQSHEGESGTIGTTADGPYLWFYANGLHGFQRQYDDVHVVGFDFFAHVVILVLQLKCHCCGAKLVVEFAGEVFQLFFAAFKPVSIVIPDDIGHHGLLHVTMKTGEVVKTFVGLSVFWGVVPGQQGGKLVGDAYSVQHLMFGIAGMNVATFDNHLGTGGVEVFVFQLPDFTTVDGIRPVGSESGHVEVIGALSDFLIGRETDANGTMFDFGMSQEVFHGRDNLCQTGFVVGAQQGFTIGTDQILSLVKQEFGKFSGRQHHTGLRIQQDVATVVLTDDLRIDIFA